MFENCDFNPQMPKVKIHLRTPRGVPPWILVFPSEFFGNIFHVYVFGVKESNGDNEKFYLYCMTLKIKVKHLFV